MILQHTLELPRPFGILPIRRWFSNSLETNFLMPNSRGFMMATLTAGRLRISIANAIIRVLLWQSLRPPRISSLEDSLQLNGNPLQEHLESISVTPTRSFSVWMRARNTLSRAERNRLLDVKARTVPYLGRVVMS